jgi:Mg2+ and Co2+ transporter CorA
MSDPAVKVHRTCSAKARAFALYAVMDFIVDQYFPVIHELEQDLPGSGR